MTTYLLRHKSGKVIHPGQHLLPPHNYKRLLEVFASTIKFEDSNDDIIRHWDVAEFGSYEIVKQPDAVKPTPMLAFDTGKAMVEVEIEKVRITLPDSEVRAIIEKHLRDKYAQLTDEHNIAVLGIVPSLETNVEIWRKLP